MPAKIEPVFDGKTWCGLATAYNMHFCIEMFPASDYPGHYHMSVVCLTDEKTGSYVDSTKKPVRADAAQAMLNFALTREGLCMADITWQELTDKTKLNIEHPDRGQINGKA